MTVTKLLHLNFGGPSPKQPINYPPQPSLRPSLTMGTKKGQQMESPLGHHQRHPVLPRQLSRCRQRPSLSTRFYLNLLGKSVDHPLVGTSARLFRALQTPAKTALLAQSQQDLIAYLFRNRLTSLSLPTNRQSPCEFQLEENHPFNSSGSKTDGRPFRFRPIQMAALHCLKFFRSLTMRLGRPVVPPVDCLNTFASRISDIPPTYEGRFSSEPSEF